MFIKNVSGEGLIARTQNRMDTYYNAHPFKARAMEVAVALGATAAIAPLAYEVGQSEWSGEHIDPIITPIARSVAEYSLAWAGVTDETLSENPPLPPSGVDPGSFRITNPLELRWQQQCDQVLPKFICE